MKTPSQQNAKRIAQDAEEAFVRSLQEADFTIPTEPMDYITAVTAACATALAQAYCSTGDQSPDAADVIDEHGILTAFKLGFESCVDAIRSGEMHNNLEAE
jgi:hypothetical protein